MIKKFFIILTLIFLPISVLGASPIEDDFNDYSDGDLNGNGAWTGDASFNVQGTTIYEGAKAIQQSLDGKDIQITGASTADGTLYYYTQSDNTNDALALFILESSNTKCSIRLSETGYIQWYTGSGYTNIVPYIEDTWYVLAITWETSGNTCNFGYATATDQANIAWTGTQSAPAFTNIDTVKFSNQLCSSGCNWYFDYISGSLYEEIPTPTVLDYDLLLCIIMLGIFIIEIFEFISLSFKI